MTTYIILLYTIVTCGIQLDIIILCDAYAKSIVSFFCNFTHKQQILDTSLLLRQAVTPSIIYDQSFKVGSGVFRIFLRRDMTFFGNNNIFFKLKLLICIQLNTNFGVSKFQQYALNLQILYYKHTHTRTHTRITHIYIYIYII